MSFTCARIGVLLDAIEERREAADVVRLARQGGGQVEAEAIDMHLRDPVAQAIHEQLQRRGELHVQRIARAGVIHVEAPLSCTSR